MKRTNDLALVLALAGLALGGCLVPRQGPGGASSGGGYSGGGGGGGDPYAGGGGGGDPTGGGGGGGGPQSVSVTIRSSCPDTVKVFYGDKPKFGSGTSSSIESNSVQSHTFNVGESIWIIDDEENGVSQRVIDANTSTIEVSSSCASWL